MGRPLYSSVLLSRQNAAASDDAVEHSDVASPHVPAAAVEKWSQWNAFDPDSDEFFEDAVDETFLTEEQIATLLARQAEGRRTNGTRIAEVVAEAAGAANPPEGVVEAGMLRGGLPGLEDELLSETSERTFEEDSQVAPPVPRIILAPPISPTSETAEGLSPPAEQHNLLGLPHLSESPQSIQPLDPLSRPVSPIPDTPARVSGIFSTTSSSHALHTSSVMSISESIARGTRNTYPYYTLPDRVSRLPGDQPSLYRYPAVPSPLTS